ncbi:MAG: hypothetical protein GXP59_08440 [Deltaproteobacteria bacterium]|nr:hypothetical protein [Deltaproteobacteria bacterium]
MLFSAKNLWWLGIFSLVSFIATLIAIPLILVKIPADYFLETSEKAGLRPAIMTLIGRNILGFVFLVMGIIMLFTPGQGILTMLIGLSLLNFPGKRRLELNLIRRPQVQRAINWLRAKYGKPPLLIP